MIYIRLNPSGQVEITPKEDSPALGWLEDLSKSPFFSSAESEASISTPPSDIEEFNEDWEEYALPEVLSNATAWQKRFAPHGGCLRFFPSEKLEMAGFLNRARLKIAMEGTGDILPPSLSSLRREQYEFYTALVEFVLSVPEPPSAYFVS